LTSGFEFAFIVVNRIILLLIAITY